MINVPVRKHHCSPLQVKPNWVVVRNAQNRDVSENENHIESDFSMEEGLPLQVHREYQISSRIEKHVIQNHR
ncbi:hypothetical protein VIGAN_01290400 [Vigna angularis var. angularis]|uniref:Uncharacterized protein n=1 Tax=Vigna angularis var. angularis TaxID=157739 RepID=A0A0S3R3L6_PHAAN|nr:hypothetical protein VIGAN_01290400 [Vigna angularis var. angularis]